MTRFRSHLTYEGTAFVYGRHGAGAAFPEPLVANPFSIDLAFLGNRDMRVRVGRCREEKRTLVAGQGGMHGCEPVAFLEVSGPAEYVEITPSLPLLHTMAEALHCPAAAGLAERHDLMDPVLWAAAVRIRANACGGEPLGAMEAAELLHQLVAHLMVSYLGAQRPRCNARQLDVKRLATVADYIESHLTEDVPLEDLAALVYQSPFHFLRAFRATTGLTPHQFLVSRRMARAREALVDGVTIQEAARRSGYRNTAHFRQTFARFFGVKPAELAQAFGTTG